MGRTLTHLPEELEGLKGGVLEKGGGAQKGGGAPLRGLVARDATAVDGVLRGDEPVNQLHIDIDNRCFRLLALYQPMATDLRAVVAAVKINTDLERVGDLAVNIAEAGTRYTN